MPTLDERRWNGLEATMEYDGQNLVIHRQFRYDEQKLRTSSVTVPVKPSSLVKNELDYMRRTGFTENKSPELQALVKEAWQKTDWQKDDPKIFKVFESADYPYNWWK